MIFDTYLDCASSLFIFKLDVRNHGFVHFFGPWSWHHWVWTLLIFLAEGLVTLGHSFWIGNNGFELRLISTSVNELLHVSAVSVYLSIYVFHLTHFQAELN